MIIRITDGSRTQVLANGSSRALYVPVLEADGEFGASIMEQLRQFLRGTSAKSVDRGNHAADGMFTASTAFSNVEEAQRFKYLHPVVTLRSSSLQIELDTNVTITIPDMTIRQIRVRIHGARAFASYQFRGGRATYAAAFSITAPTGGWLRTFNPNSTSFSEAAAVLATVISDAQGTPGSWSVTEPAGGWLRTLDPSSVTPQNFADVVATIANEFTGTANIYSVAYWPFQYAFNPNATDPQTACNVLATFLNDLQFAGTIG